MQKGYRGIDLFRLMAAVLVIAIHVSPLEGIWMDGDFVLTRILARIAVPFFFMASGFFFMEKYGKRDELVWNFLRKTGWIYFWVVLAYLPLNIYKGYFGAELTLPVLLKDLCFDGMFYHLWYLPASMAGMLIAWGLVRRFSFKGALLITGILYGIGLLGDSYYGLIYDMPLIRAFYDNLFLMSDYTRNGIFFAPLFLALGMRFHAVMNYGKTKKRYWNGVGLVLSLILMVAEGMVLHERNLQRHDSMYLFLPFAEYFLFGFLCTFDQRRIKNASRISLMVYLIHPMVIVGLRMTDKVLGIRLFSENPVVQFLGTIVLSFGMAWVLVEIVYLLLQRYGQKKEKTCTYRAWMELNLENLRHNVNEIKQILPEGCRFMAVIKAQAYGHGAVIVAEALNNIGVDAFAVATIEEAIELRRNAITGEILILNYTDAKRARELKRYNLIQTAVDYEHCKELNKAGIRMKVHLKIDTGMKRLGMDAGDVERIAEVFSMKNLDVCGMYTHLCVSDSLRGKDVEFTGRQEKTFYHLMEELKKKNVKIPQIHLQSSYGLLNYPDMRADYVRIGIAMYGTLSDKNDKIRSEINLLPVLALKSMVVHLISVNDGESVGYGCDYVADGDRRIAVVSIGYADGIPRSLSNQRGRVLVQGKYAPIVGRICMDQMMVDITGIEGIGVGCPVVVIGKMQEKEIKVTDFAENAETIANEILSRLGRRVIPVCR